MMSFLLVVVQVKLQAVCGDGDEVQLIEPHRSPPYNKDPVFHHFAAYFLIHYARRPAGYIQYD